MADTWSMALHNWAGTRVGIIEDATERKFNPALNKPATVSFQVRPDNEIMPYLFEDVAPYWVQVWQNSVLRYYGPIISSNYTVSDAGTPSIAVTSADPSWFLSKRIVATGITGQASGHPGFLTYGPADKITISEALITESNNYSTTFIAPHGDLSGTTATWTSEVYETVLTAIGKMAHSLSGFDWYIEPSKLNANERGIFRGAATVGKTVSTTAFEYGAGLKNIRSMGFMRDFSNMANIVWDVAGEGPEISGNNPTPTLVRYNTVLENRYGRYEDVSGLGIQDVTQRGAYAEEIANVRGAPRRVFSMTQEFDDESGRVPKFGTDYWLGDMVPARAVVNGTVLFNGLARVYGAEISLNNAGTATVTPILIDEGE